MNHINFTDVCESNAMALAFSNLTEGFADTNQKESGRGRITPICQNHLLNRFSNLGHGRLTVSEGGKEWQLGKARISSSNELTASIFVNRPEFYRRILLGGTIGAAESFIDGAWDTDDLTAVIRIVIQNMKKMARLEKTWARVRNTTHWIQHQLRRNTKAGSRRNIEEHYDLGNDFYALFLDSTMNYSSGIFPHESSSMLEASLTKMDWIGQKLQLKPTDHVLEIGTGWGGLAIHLAKHFGCRVTTTTISKQQFAYAKDKVAAEGLEDRITLLLSDYRDLEGTYDKIVSIEMIEAVGHQYFDQYFGKCSSLLKDDGLMLIQAITMSQQNYSQHIKNIDFIRRYVFPGGCLPSDRGDRRVGRSLDRYANRSSGRHYRTLCADTAEMAAEISRSNEPDSSTLAMTNPLFVCGISISAIVKPHLPNAEFTTSK